MNNTLKIVFFLILVDFSTQNDNSQVSKILTKQAALPEILAISSPLEIVFPASLAGTAEGNFTLLDTEVQGHNDYKISNWSLSLPLDASQINFTIIFPSLRTRSNYSSDLILFGAYWVHGNGTIELNFNDIEVGVSTRVNSTPYVHFTESRYALTLGEKSNTSLEGLYLNQTLLPSNFFLFDMVVGYVNTNEELISDALSPGIENILNEAFKAVFTPVIPAPQDDVIPAPNIDDDDIEIVESAAAKVAFCCEIILLIAAVLIV